MPDCWLPNEFLACCAFCAPSGDEEASWRLDVGASPKPNARNISSALSILPLTPNQGVFGRIKQRSEEQERSKILQGKAIRLRNKERQRKRKRGEINVSDDEEAPLTIQEKREKHQEASTNYNWPEIGRNNEETGRCIREKRSPCCSEGPLRIGPRKC